jgi:protoporphyrinogen oxidase
MSKSIAIIGGGLTGLTCGYELLKKGFDVTIFEKEKKVGGLASSFQLSDNYLEKFYHHVFDTDKYFLDLIKELGLENKLLWLESSVSIYRDETLFPFSSPFDLLNFKPVPFIDRIRIGLITLFLQKYKNWEKFKDVSAYDWMQKYAGKKVTKIIWEPLLKGKFGKAYKEISMAWLWARIHVRVNSRENLGSKEMLGYIDGGFQIFIDKLERGIINNGGKIITESNVSNIEQRFGGEISLYNEKKEYLYDKILFTVPSPLLRGLFSEKETKKEQIQNYLKRIEKIKYLGTICLVFTSKQDLSKYYWHNINEKNAPFLVFINHTKLLNKKNYSGKYVYYIAKYLEVHDELYEKDKEEISRLWLSYLDKMFDNFDEDRITQKFLFKSSYAQHIADRNYYNIVPNTNEITKNIYLANFSLIYPEDRGMNYAIREGVKLAKKLSNA